MIRSFLIWSIAGIAPFVALAFSSPATPAQTSPLHVNPAHLQNVPVVNLNPIAFAYPQSVMSPSELQTISGPERIVSTPNVNSVNSTKTVIATQNPSIVFKFPIVPDIDYYNDPRTGVRAAYPTIGITAAVGLEACLTAQEAQPWSGATLIGQDAIGCPPETDIVHAKFLQRAWYQVASAKVDEYVIQNRDPINAPTPLPVNLQQIDTPIRVHVKGFIYYYTNVHTGSNDLGSACPSTACGNGNFEMRTNPFSLVVLPAFMFQLKALPQTIVYLPPGNASYGSYTVTNTFATTLSAGDTTEIDNSNSNDQWAEDVNDNGVTFSVQKIFSLGYSNSSDTKWDDKTTVKTGQSIEHDLQNMTQVQNVLTSKVTANNTNVPGSGGTPANEAYWGDEVVVLIHPQFAVWDFYGRINVQLIAASNSTLPDYVPEPIANLDACANSRPGPFSGGISILAESGAQVILDARDCHALAVLDPFYGWGQSADVSARGTLFLPEQGYGISPISGDEQSIDLKQINSEQATLTTQSTQTYSATVEDIVATSQSAGLKIGVNAPIPSLTLGLSNDYTLKQGSTTDTAQSMILTYKNSTANSYRTDIAVEGSIDDKVNRVKYQPRVVVYLDKLFGGLIPVDPDAPRAPCTPQPNCQIQGPINGPRQ